MNEKSHRGQTHLKMTTRAWVILLKYQKQHLLCKRRIKATQGALRGRLWNRLSKIRLSSSNYSSQDDFKEGATLRRSVRFESYQIAGGGDGTRCLFFRQYIAGFLKEAISFGKTNPKSSKWIRLLHNILWLPATWCTQRWIFEQLMELLTTFLSNTLHYSATTQGREWKNCKK